MTDHFARFGLEPAPWLDPEQLKERFLALSAESHPDKAADKPKAEESFRALNESYQVLRNSRSRILHLLELRGVAKPEHVQAIPPVALDLFPSIADLSRNVDALLKEKAAAHSPMLKVQFFEKALPLLDSIQSVQTEVQKRLHQAQDELRTVPTTDTQRLQQAAAALGFLEKWHAQLQDRAARLTF